MNKFISIWQDLIVYQIYIRSFYDSNGDGIGDLRGIIEKFDYLAGKPDSLGVNAIWINPFFKSPQVDFGYDVSDYCGIDPVYGNMNDLEDLIILAHKRGVKVLLDLVPNHTSIEHSWFIESASSRTNSKQDWYIWKDPAPDGGVPNNWLSRFGGSAWEFCKSRQQYYLHSFFKEQPDLNWRNKSVQDEFKKIFRFWFGKGVDGFRVDAVHYLIKDRHFKDEPENKKYSPRIDEEYFSLQHVYTRNQPEVSKIIKLFESVCKEFKDKILVTEVTMQMNELINFYNKNGDSIHSPFNLKLMRVPWEVIKYRRFIEKFDKSLKSGVYPNYVLNNHDRPRLVDRVGQDKARVAAMLLLTLRGSPFLYYGEEIGMSGDVVKSGVVRDFYGRDTCRGPMQWKSGKYVGFSNVEPWLPVSKVEKSKTVEMQVSNDNSLYNLYRALIKLRLEKEVLRTGHMKMCLKNSKKLLAYERILGKQKLLVVLNFSNAIQSLSIRGEARLLLSTTSFKDVLNEYVKLQSYKLGPFEGVIFELREAS